MPKADPQAGREIAVKHLFRHLGDERQLLRNPLVGAEIRGGTVTAHELRVRVARAAEIIRDEDANRGRAQRGARQAACLVRCDLGSESLATLAAEFAISPRQLARERREAWLRALQHVVTKTTQLTSASINDVVHNRALALFRLGRANDGVEIMRGHIARAGPEASLLGLCNLASMEHDFKRNRDARETYEELIGRVAAAGRARSQPRLQLALNLLGVLFKPDGPPRSWYALVGELARRAAVETPTAPGASRTILRLFFSLSQKFIHTHDYRNMFATCAAVDDFLPSLVDLDCHEAFSLHALRAISEWKRNGFNLDMEAHMFRALHVAISNGWTAAVAESSSLLSSVYYLSDNIVAAREYRDMALGAIALTDDKRAVAMTYSNLATTALDSDCVGAAAHFRDLCLRTQPEDHPLLEHVPLLVAEISVRQGQVERGTASARDVLQRADRSGNARLVAVAGRVVALGLTAKGERRAAVALIGRSVDLAVSGACSKYDVHRIERSQREIGGQNSAPAPKNLTDRHFRA